MPSHLDCTIATFEATIHRTKNRCVTIPAAEARKLGLRHRPDNHIIHVSIRKAGLGRWNHHYFKLTANNEFALPTDIAGLEPGDQIDVKVHRLVADAAASEQVAARGSTAADVLLNFARRDDLVGWRADGSVRVDGYLREEMLR